MNSAACGRQPLSSLRAETHPVAGDGCGPKANIVKANCHMDCVKHCKYETITEPHCKDQDKCYDKRPCDTAVGAYGAGNCWTGLCMFFIWFLIIFFIVAVILWLLKPTWVLRPVAGGFEVDVGKVVLYSALIALIIIIIIWLIKTFACGGRYF